MDIQPDNFSEFKILMLEITGLRLISVGWKTRYCSSIDYSLH
jgi:hypothetical protein